MNMHAEQLLMCQGVSSHQMNVNCLTSSTVSQLLSVHYVRLDN